MLLELINFLTFKPKKMQSKFFNSDLFKAGALLIAVLLLTFFPAFTVFAFIVYFLFFRKNSVEVLEGTFRSILNSFS